MTAIIQVPSAYPIKLPQGEWINLAAFRRVKIIDGEPVIHITWDDDADTIYQGEQAQAILDALEEAQSRAVAGAIAQNTPSEEDKDLATVAVVSMVALALLGEAIESNGGSEAEQLIEAFTHKAKDFYANSSQEEVENFMNKYF